MMRRGLKLRVIQETSGHAWFSTTQLYTHVVNEDLKKAMQEY
jgi:site-specific recombinase XerD